tara:strand:+ start:77 stop:568 length:492 start_codon:yes stop_codon:yes gene_type:complete
MNKFFFLKIVLVALFVLLAQIFIPVITLYNFRFAPDILIIFLSYIGLYYGRFLTIIIGFLLGLSQDLITQLELMGAMAFTKSVIGFCLGTLNLYPNVWSGRFKLFFIFIMYNFHFFIFNFIKFNGLKIESLIVSKIIIINSLISFVILIIIDKILLDGVIAKK